MFSNTGDSSSVLLVVDLSSTLPSLTALYSYQSVYELVGRRQQSRDNEKMGVTWRRFYETWLSDEQKGRVKVNFIFVEFGSGYTWLYQSGFFLSLSSKKF